MTEEVQETRNDELTKQALIEELMDLESEYEQVQQKLRNDKHYI